MRWSLNIGTIAGTAVRVHITFLLFLIWIFAANYASGGADAASLARYFAGAALSLEVHASQQRKTLRPSTSTATGSPIEPSFAPVTGQTFCSWGVASLVAAGASLARYLVGSALILGGHASQHVHTF